MATIKGKWKWNEVLDCHEDTYVNCTVPFKSNGIQYGGFILNWGTGYYLFMYDIINGGVLNIDESTYEDDYELSVPEEYRIIDFGDTNQEIDSVSYNFLVKNATEIRPSLTFNADVIIPYNLTVQGTTITENAESILVQGAVMVVNSNNAEFEVTLVGTVYRTGSGDYGILYNPTTQAVELGYGAYDEDLNTFTFNEGEGKPIAVRDLSAEDDGNLVMWDAENYCLTGVKIGNGLTVSEDKTLSVTTPNILTGTTAPTNEIGNNGDIYLWYEE